MLQKASITDDKGDRVEFQFNPEKVSFTRTVKFPDKSEANDRQYVGTDPIELQLTMELDEVGSRAPTLADRVKTMLKWTTPVQGSDPKQPHLLTFTWGQLKIGTEDSFQCHCKAVKVEYTLFTPAGIPVRGTVTITLLGLPPKEDGTNPTSGGMQPVRSRQIGPGDHLPVLTHREYGDTSSWREVARRNRIDNPFRPRLGTEVLFPARLDLEDG